MTKTLTEFASRILKWVDVAKLLWATAALMVAGIVSVTVAHRQVSEQGKEIESIKVQSTVQSQTFEYQIKGLKEELSQEITGVKNEVKHIHKQREADGNRLIRIETLMETVRDDVRDIKVDVKKKGDLK